MQAVRRRRLLATGVIPVIVLEDASKAGELGAALVSGGLEVAEVTLRTEAALDSISAMAQDRRLLVGAGTVVTRDQVDAAVDAGAQFIVSPGISVDVVRRARELDVPVMAGVVTPSEVMTAMKLELDVLKFFPAGAFGGAATVKSFHSPFGGVKFVPTGGVDESTMADYLRLPNVAAVGGTWMVKPRLIAAGAFQEVAQLCREAVALAQRARTEAA